MLLIISKISETVYNQTYYTPWHKHARCSLSVSGIHCCSNWQITLTNLTENKHVANVTLWYQQTPFHLLNTKKVKVTTKWIWRLKPVYQSYQYFFTINTAFLYNRLHLQLILCSLSVLSVPFNTNNINPVSKIWLTGTMQIQEHNAKKPSIPSTVPDISHVYLSNVSKNVCLNLTATTGTYQITLWTQQMPP